MIMKKVMMLATLVLLGAMTLCAQSLDGTWKADEEIKKMMDLNEEGTDMDWLMDFKGSKANLTLKVSVRDDDMSMVMAIAYDGKFSRKGNSVTTTFDKAGRKFNIVSLESSDPEMKEMLANETTRKLVYALIEEKAKEGLADSFKQIDEIVELVKTFEVKSITANKLTISIEDTEMGFDKVK